MKQQINPGMAVVVVVIAVLIIGGFIFFNNRSTDGHLPTPEQAASGQVVGGKRLPSAAGMGGSGAAGPANAPNSGSAGAQ